MPAVTPRRSHTSVRWDGTRYGARPGTGLAHFHGPSEPTGAVGDLWTRTPKFTPVIIDTDWWSDPDDVVALRVAVNCERLGLIDIRAVTMNTTLQKGPGSIDALLTYDGRPGVPIGFTNTAHTPSGSNLFQDRLYDNLPHQVGLQATAENSVTLMRRVLADADTRVDIIAQGFCNNLEDLLRSTADSVSDLTGSQLVAAKVGTLWMSAGQWPTGSEYNFTTTALASSSGSYVMANWPATVPMVLLDFECGEEVLSCGNMRKDYPHDPVWKALNDVSYPHGRKSWGAMIVRLAAVGDITLAGYTGTRGTGAVNSSTGANTWTDSATGPHTYLTRSNSISWFERDLEKLVLPPRAWTPDEARGETRVFKGGAWIPVDSVVRLGGESNPGKRDRETSTYDTGLWMHLHADDLSGQSDNTAVVLWPCRVDNLPARQPTSGNRPVYRSSVGSKTAVQSAGSKWLFTDPVLCPREVTIYVTAYYATSVPGGASTWISAHDPSDVARGWHLKMASGVPTAVAFYNDSATYTDTTTAQSADAWHVIAMRSSPQQLQLEVFVDGTGSGSPTTISGTLNQVRVPVAIMSRFWNQASESVTGNIHEIRVYDVWHNNATVAAISTEMLAS